MKLDGIEATYGKFHLEIDAVLLDGATAIFGASGAGKTTLLEIIAGVKRPEKGRLTLDTQVLFDCERRLFVPPRERKIGYVPQDLALFPHMTVEANIRYGEVAADPATRSSFQMICEVLELDNKLDQYPASLSGGEEQRVAFARALMTRPRLLLLDEPLRGLHNKLKDKVVSFLLEIKRQFALPILYVTHSPSEVMALCEHVLLLDKGNVVGQGKPSDYFVETTSLTYNLKSAPWLADEHRPSPDRRLDSHQ